MSAINRHKWIQQCPSVCPSVQLAKSNSVMAQSAEIERQVLETQQKLQDERQRLSDEAVRLKRISDELAVTRAEAVSQGCCLSFAP